MSNRQTFVIIFLVILAVGAGGFTAGYFYRAQTADVSGFPIFNQAYAILRDHGLKELPPAPLLEYGMIRGLLQAYDDPYTLFVDPPQAELESNALHGSFGGIGVGLSRDDAGNVTLFPLPDGPAALAGVLEGDRLLAVADTPIGPDTSMETVQALVRGPVGQWVNLQIGRPPDFAPLDVRVKRAEIPLPSVVARLDPDEPRLGVIQVNLIAASTAEEVEKAAADLQARGAAYFVLDLRDNPGGLLDAGVEVARLFLKDGVVMEQQYRGQEVKTFRVEKPGPLSELPLVVIVNGNSASAAEIVAGALQANARAPLVGAPTYGKNSIQLVFELDDLSSLHVTAARWWTPGLDGPLQSSGSQQSGGPQQGGVLQPDILVTPDPDPNAPDVFLQTARAQLLGQTGGQGQ